MSSSKDSTLFLKCGILSGDRQIGDFRFVSWFYGLQKGYVRPQPYARQTLTERLKSIFPDIVTPFRVIFIDEDEDKIVLPADDIKETVVALQCFDYLSTVPIQIFIQLPDNSCSTEDEKSSKGERAIKSNDDNSLKIVEKLNHLELTVQSLGQRIVTLLESLNERCSEKVVKSTVIPPLEKSVNSKISLNEPDVSEPPNYPIMAAESLLMSPNTHREPSESSSSSFSVQSHSGEDDWTRVGANRIGVGPRRRRFMTESSCASNHSADNFTVQNVFISLTAYILLCVLYRWFYR